MSGLVRLREAEPRDIGLLDVWRRTPAYAGEFNDFDLPAHSYRYAVESGSTIDDRGGLLVVEKVADGAAVGTVTWHAVSYGPNPESRAWNIGISLVPQARGRGYGSEAQRLLADYLFETTPAHRIEASTDVENGPEHRALEKAGFRREGVARGAQHRKGVWHDMVTYARLRTDP
ncbi:MAG: GNAT family N-acetyltransferase [Streptomycetales bacterium]